MVARTDSTGKVDISTNPGFVISINRRLTIAAVDVTGMRYDELIHWLETVLIITVLLFSINDV